MNAVKKKKSQELIEPFVPWGASEVADELGVTISNLDKVVGLPEPRRRNKGGRLWSADDVRKFARERRERIDDREAHKRK